MRWNQRFDPIAIPTGRSTLGTPLSLADRKQARISHLKEIPVLVGAILYSRDETAGEGRNGMRALVQSLYANDAFFHIPF